jgi:hypothetical protein
MKTTYKSIIFAGALLCATAAAGQGFSFVEPAPVQSGAAAQSAQARQDELYNDGTQLMNESKWEQAAEKFNAAVKAGGGRTAGAMYWAGYCMNKLNMRNEAISIMRDVKRQYPSSNWAKSADQRLLEWGATDPKQVIQEKDPDEDLKIMALRNICEQDAGQCVPIARRFLEKETNSHRVKEKVMFILVQSGSKSAQELVGEIARGKLYPALQVKAIQNLGIEGTESNLKTMSEIYATTTDVSVKKKILESFGVAGAKSRLLTAAKSETNPDLQKRAVQSLGVAGGDDELRELYRTITDAGMKRYILEGLMVAGAADTLAEIARTEPDQGVRLKAIQMVGVAGGRKMGATLLAIWNANPDYETRKAVSEALFVGGDSATLIQLAKAEKDPQMKRRLVEKISLMGDKASRDYMIQILEQE